MVSTDLFGELELLTWLYDVRDTPDKERKCPHGPGWIYSFNTLQCMNVADMVAHVFKDRKYTLEKRGTTIYARFPDRIYALWVHRST